MKKILCTAALTLLFAFAYFIYQGNIQQKRETAIHRIVEAGGRVILGEASAPETWTTPSAFNRPGLPIDSLWLRDGAITCVTPYELSLLNDTNLLVWLCDGAKSDEPYLKEIARFQNLEHLALGKVDGSQLSWIANKVNLQSLHVDVEDSASLRHLSKLERLRNLTISVNRGQDSDFDFLSSLKALKSVTIVAYRGVTGRFTQKLTSASSLYSATFELRDGVCADISSISLLTSIEELDLSYCPVDDGILPSIKSLPHLRRVSLARTQLTDKSVPELMSWRGIEVDVSGVEGIAEADVNRIFNR
ncbi:MAG: hypothetical protein U1A77_07730 [Pirellulales bacterium]